MPAPSARPVCALVGDGGRRQGHSRRRGFLPGPRTCAALRRALQGVRRRVRAAMAEMRAVG
jgi:hypothetical protein